MCTSQKLIDESVFQIIVESGEGAIIRKCGSPYIHGRSEELIKVKVLLCFFFFYLFTGGGFAFAIIGKWKRNEKKMQTNENKMKMKWKQNETKWKQN